jgi:hypothetical protein
MSGQLHFLAALAPEKQPPVRELSGPQSRSGRRGEEKNVAPTGTRTPTPRPVAILALILLSCLIMLVRTELFDRCLHPRASHRTGT